MKYLELTLPEFMDCISSLENRYKYSEIELINYLENVTGVFDKERTKVVLDYVYSYYGLEFIERAKSESEQIYKENGWQIPMTEIVTRLKPNSNQISVRNVVNVDEMREKTHGYQETLILDVIRILRDKINVDIVPDNKETNSYPLIFKDGKFDLFTKIKDEYITKESGAKAKLCELYHYFSDKDWLLCSQLEYIDFIKEEYEVKLSKILPRTFHYNEKVVLKFDGIIG